MIIYIYVYIYIKYKNRKKCLYTNFKRLQFGKNGIFHNFKPLFIGIKGKWLKIITTIKNNRINNNNNNKRKVFFFQMKT